MSAQLWSAILNPRGPNYERLQALKRHYDPTNRFRMNLNIPPAA